LQIVDKATFFKENALKSAFLLEKSVLAGNLPANLFFS